MKLKPIEERLLVDTKSSNWRNLYRFEPIAKVLLRGVSVEDYLQTFIDTYQLEKGKVIAVEDSATDVAEGSILVSIWLLPTNSSVWTIK